MHLKRKQLFNYEESIVISENAYIAESAIICFLRVDLEIYNLTGRFTILNFVMHHFNLLTAPVAPFQRPQQCGKK